jgi:hypothetical protein
MVHGEMTRFYPTTSAVFLGAACIIFSLLLDSCAPQPANVSIPQLPWAVTGQFMQAGDFMILSSVRTQREYGCMASRGMRFQLGQTTIHPQRVQPRGRIDQLLYYYLCAPASYDTLQVRVTRVVSFSGKELIQAVDDYKLKSGTWAISVIFHLPQDLESGEYILNTTVSYQDKTEMRSASFYVEKPSAKR